MFRNTFQSGFLSILYSIGSKPLQIWDKKVRNGHIKRITDPDIQSSVLEIMGTNVSTNYITCPADPRKTLGIKLPFLVMIIKNVRKISCTCSSWDTADAFFFFKCSFYLVAQKILHIWSSSSWWQKRPKAISGIKLPINYKSQTIYLHYAHEAWWGVESDSV